MDGRLTMLRGAAAALMLLGASAFASPPPPVSDHSDGDEMLLAVQLDNEVIAEVLPTYVSADGVLVPIGELSKDLGLAITARPEEGIAEGWAISENRQFLLHMGTSTASFDDHPITWAPGEVERHDDDLFVDIRLLQKLLPIDFSVDLHASTLIVKPREQLPFQLQRERQRKLALAAGTADYQPHFPEVKLPYSLWKTPSVDQTVNAAATRTISGTWASPGVSYTTVATGELLFMQTDLYAAGGIDGPPDVRVHMGRKDPEGALLGPLHATEVGFGDVSRPAMDLVSPAQNGLGVQLSNRPVTSPTHFDRNTFRGELAPGWDVELYRNGVLMGYQLSRPDGRYEFAEVPLMYGLNTFRLVFHGPQGQRREEQQIFNVGQGAVPEGELYYRFTSNLPAPKMTDVSLDRRDALLELDYGLYQNLSTGLAVATLVRDGRDHTYARGRVQGFWKWLSGTADVAAEANGGAAAQGLLRFQLGNVRLSAQHAQLWHFESEQFDASKPLRAQSSVRFDGTVPLGTRGLLPFDAELRRDWMLDGSFDTQVLAGVAARFGRFGAAQRVSWDLQGEDRSPTFHGIANADFGKWGLRGNVDYRLKPTEVTGGTLLAETHPFENYFLSGGVGWAEQDLRYQASVGKTEGIFGMSLNGTWSKTGGLGVMLALSIAFKHDERKGGWDVQAHNATDAGAASARVFLDSNGNGVMDSGEQPLKNVQLEVNGASAPAKTDADGVAVLPRLTAHVPTDIGLVERTLEDPYWKPTREGYQVVPRPGRMATLDFPVRMTGEVTGTLYLKNAERKRELSGVGLELIAADGTVTRTRSAYDGFYNLPNLIPGRYTLRVAQDSRLASLSVPPPREIQIKADGTVIDGADFVLEDSRPVLASVKTQTEAPKGQLLKLPENLKEPFEIEAAEGPLKVKVVTVAKFPLASWAAGLPLSEEEMKKLEEIGGAVGASPNARLVIISHAQTMGAPEGAQKRAARGADLLKRYMKAVQFVPVRKVVVSVLPQEPGSEPLGFIELVLVETLDGAPAAPAGTLQM